MTGREEDLETLLHHLFEAQKIVARLKFRGSLKDALADAVTTTRKHLRKAWRNAQSEDGEI